MTCSVQFLRGVVEGEERADCANGKKTGKISTNFEEVEAIMGRYPKTVAGKWIGTKKEYQDYVKYLVYILKTEPRFTLSKSQKQILAFEKRKRRQIKRKK